MYFTRRLILESKYNRVMSNGKLTKYDWLHIDLAFIAKHNLVHQVEWLGNSKGFIGPVYVLDNQAYWKHPKTLQCWQFSVTNAKENQTTVVTVETAFIDWRNSRDWRMICAEMGASHFSDQPITDWRQCRSKDVHEVRHPKAHPPPTFVMQEHPIMFKWLEYLKVNPIPFNRGQQ